MMLIFKNIEFLVYVIDIIEVFGKYVGLKINLNKMECIFLGILKD